MTKYLDNFYLTKFLFSDRSFQQKNFFNTYKFLPTLIGSFSVVDGFGFPPKEIKGSLLENIFFMIHTSLDIDFWKNVTKNII